jgi:hypothetical protein
VKALAAQGEKGLLAIVAATHSGMSVEEFSKLVLDWTTAKHPRFKRLYTELVYQPMLELMTYCGQVNSRRSSCRVAASSSCGPGRKRSMAFRRSRSSAHRASQNSRSIRMARPLRKLPKVEFIEDGPGKPVGINRFIGRYPIFAFGNSDGDLQMLKWTAAHPGARFMNAERENAYDRNSRIGRLDKALDEAKKRGWTVVNMKADWKRIFPNP